MDYSGVLLTLISLFIGAAITWWVTYIYYKKAGDELKIEASRLHEQTQLILTSMEQAGLVELRREKGIIVGFKTWKVKLEGFQNQSSFGNLSISYDQDKSL